MTDLTIQVTTVHSIANRSMYRTSHHVHGVSDTDSGYGLRNPTYNEVMEFIASDSTDKNQYCEENYTCADFAADLKSKALEAGYNCGYVVIEFPDTGHTIVCFNTTDRGLIFIEPQEDEIVTLTIGQPYWDRTEHQVTYDDTVVRFTIVW